MIRIVDEHGEVGEFVCCLNPIRYPSGSIIAKYSSLEPLIFGIGIIFAARYFPEFVLDFIH